MTNKPPDFLAQLTGSFAKPAAENPTVAMVEAAYRHHGLNWRYINCEVPPELLGDAVRGAKAMGWAGFNCSIPNKIAVIQYLDGLGESAQIIGAVNTVVRRDDRYIGENTDGRGFVSALRNLIDPAGKTVVPFRGWRSRPGGRRGDVARGGRTNFRGQPRPKARGGTGPAFERQNGRKG
jgi:shikimate dehydrogenase